MADVAESAEAKARWLAVTTSWIDGCLLSENAVAWKDMAVGVRTIELVLGFPLVPPEERAKFLFCIRIHAKHLANWRNHARGNHLLHQLQGLYVAARFLRDARLEAAALRHAAKLLTESFDEEGVNAEGALGYHDMNIHWWGQLSERLSGEDNSLPGLNDTLRTARGAIIHAVRPDGKLETIGDTASSKRPLVSVGPRVRYVRSRGREGRKPSELARCFRDGYAFGRSGWGRGRRRFEDETFYSLRFGPDKSMHGHRDSTSFTIHARRISWVVDPGMYAYGNSEMRAYMCSRAAHNVVLDTRRPNYPNNEARLVTHRLGKSLDAYRMETVPSPQLRVRRDFVYHREGEFFVVVDRIEEVGGGVPEHARQLWHLGHGVEVEATSAGYKLSASSRTAYVEWANPGSRELIVGETAPLQGWVSGRYGEAVEAPVLSVGPSAGGGPLAAVLSIGRPCTSFRLCYETGVEVIEVELGGVAYVVTLP